MHKQIIDETVGGSEADANQECLKAAHHNLPVNCFMGLAMNEKEIKLECLKIAERNQPDYGTDLVATAILFYSFICWDGNGLPSFSLKDKQDKS